MVNLIRLAKDVKPLRFYAEHILNLNRELHTDIDKAVDKDGFWINCEEDTLYLEVYF